MLLSVFLTCFVTLVISSALLFTLGHHVRFASRLAGLILVVVVVVASGEISAAIWELPSRYVEYGEAVLLAFGILVVIVRRPWNPIGQLFFGAFLASATSYLAFAGDTTFGGGLSAIGRVASFVLFVLEVAALAIATSFTFESCDAICRVRRSRRLPEPDPGHQPMVSLQIAAYNEPPDMLIDTIKSLEAIDYPRFEVVVIDNNTKDPEVWRPVEEYCGDRPNVKFVHVDELPGFKSGALNLALGEHTDPDAEIIGIIDADYRVDPAWLRDITGYFATPSVAYVQTPQDYREYEGDDYLEACYDAYKYFFAVTMPSRNERNSIIFAGTMGLLRRSVLEELGGWNEWCITEDSELSLRMLKAGYEGIFVPRSYGYGIMPLTFASLKSQRFRWCFGGMQILRLHWRELVPWNRDRDNHLTLAQRADYLVGNVQWMNDLVYFGFTLALLASAAVLIERGPFGLRPLYGAAVLLPSALIVTGVIRALWALRVRTGIGLRRALLAFLNWLSLSWTVALACLQGLTQSEGAFLRTPKVGERNRVLAALWSARAETLWTLSLWGAAVIVLAYDKARSFVVLLFVWQGLVYASAPFMSWLNQHSELSAQLERRRRTELQRERATVAKLSVATLVAAGAAVAVAVVIGFGGSQPGKPANPFVTPERAASDQGPLNNVVQGTPAEPPSTSTTEPSSTSTTTSRSTTNTTVRRTTTSVSSSSTSSGSSSSTTSP